MIESVLTRRGASVKKKVTIKTLVSVAIIASAVLLPQLVHFTTGAAGGVKWLPMYLPVLLGGCLLGFKWGLLIGILSPVTSFLITSALGSPMPALTRLPYMIVELMVFASVSGLFGGKIIDNKWLAFPAILFAAVLGRAVFLLMAFALESVSPLSFATVWAQVTEGLSGLLLQVVLLPFVVMLLASLMKRN